MYETKYQYDIIIIIEFNSIHSAEEKAPKTFSPPLSKPIRPLYVKRVHLSFQNQ
jgi:hypothetical protein